MSTETNTIEIEKTADNNGIIHRYPKSPEYRLSGADWPQVGDIARCGWRKKQPNPMDRNLTVNCVVCISLAKNL